MKRIKKKCFVLGLDGMPYSLLKTMFSKGIMKNTEKIIEQGRIKSINSVYPAVSSVAWTGFATGKEPGETNIYGFVDRVESPWLLKIPVDTSRKADNIWEKLTKVNKRSIVINVPISYPVKEINGIMVSSFLCPSIEKSTYPYDFYKYLKQKDYIIDVDANLAVTDKNQLMDQLFRAMNTRFSVCFDLLEQQDWDYFQLNIMETDRLFHFFWNHVIDEGESEFKGSVNRFFRELDGNIKRLFDYLNQDTGFLIISDHGFERIKKEVFLNKWLEDKSLLKFNNQEKGFANISKESVCFSLAPGRIYLVKDKKLCTHDSNALKEQLLSMNDEFQDNVVKNVYTKDELFHGEYIKNAPDFLVVPDSGYDFKGEFGSKHTLKKRHFEGMHTYEDAMIAGINIDINSVESVCDVSKIILQEICDEPI